MKCKNCDKEFVQNKKNLYCSPKCRNEYNNSKRNFMIKADEMRERLIKKVSGFDKEFHRHLSESLIYISEQKKQDFYNFMENEL